MVLVAGLLDEQRVEVVGQGQVDRLLGVAVEVGVRRDVLAREHLGGQRDDQGACVGGSRRGLRGEVAAGAAHQAGEGM